MTKATAQPSAKSVIEAAMKGTAYRFSLGLSPGVMNRHSSHSQTGEARKTPA